MHANTTFRTCRRQALLPWVLALSLGASAAAADDRADRILANLKIQFPQLETMDVTMGEIVPSGFEGLDRGSFAYLTEEGEKHQLFLVSRDHTQLFLINGEPIDASRTATEIGRIRAEREEAATQEALARGEELAETSVGRPVRGNPEAPITIVEFSSFQCPMSARATATVDQVLDKHPDVNLVYRHYPLEFQPWSRTAAIAAHCAGVQDPDVFWWLHDQYYAIQSELGPDTVMDATFELLEDTGLDLEAWSECAEDTDSAAHQAAVRAVEADLALANRHGARGTPTFFVNGIRFDGAQSLEVFDQTIAKARAAIE